MKHLSNGIIDVVIAESSADFDHKKSVVYIYDPRDMKGTMQRHEVEEGGMVEIPPGYSFSTVSIAPDVKVRIGEKDYGI